MKATGIVRRIDDLGRVVIPKEIRRTMRIREGDPLEIYTDADGEVIFKKYSPIGELSSFTGQYAEVLSRSTNLPVLICDRDHVIACAGIPKREAVDRRISTNLEALMEKRSNFVYSGSGESLRPVEGLERMAGIAYFNRSERAAKVMPKAARSFSFPLPIGTVGEGGVIYLKCAVCLSAAPGSPVDGPSATGGRIGAYCSPRLQSMPFPPC